MQAVLAPERSAPPGRPSLAWRPVLLIAAVFTALHAIASAFGGYWLDEAYMLAIGRYHLDFGYVDQPPMAPLLAGALEWLAPGVQLLPRVVMTLISATGVLLAGMLAREFGGDRRAQLLTALAFATGTWTALTAHWLTPYAMEVPLWMVLTWLVVRWLRLDAEDRADDRLLLAMGAVIGVTMQTKFQIALLCAALLGCVLVFGPRRLLRRPMFWAGVGIALIIAAPTLIWQAAHGWPQLAMGQVVTEETPSLSNGRRGMAVGGIVSAGVLGVPLLLCGIGRMLFGKDMRPYRFIAAAFLVQYVFYVVTSGRPYYLIGMYGVLVAAGAVGLQRRREAKTAHSSRNWSWVRWPVGVAAVLTAGGMVWLSTVAMGDPAKPLDRTITEYTAAEYRALPAGVRERTALVTGSYVPAAMLDAHSAESGLPLARSAHRGYGFFGPPGPQADNILLVGKEVDEWRPLFAQTRLVRGGDIPVWLLTGREQPWPQVWEQVRSLA
ncbi:MAG: glycosyltransferase family 39 protein [Saccharopolyspora sp.]|uniref:ArnT family glycosyltransferase n=1 Tax=Saccharopolyspora sp. TaxID=33915 RepID=UPI0025FDDB71|nr:glycosyltransferase family 39 protein [Saccharopolyspora sp.]MBQ6643172.1 glycosyltransferase family 39 protein [Saccharopolyspora sp.]